MSFTCIASCGVGRPVHNESGSLGLCIGVQDLHFGLRKVTTQIENKSLPSS